MHAIAPGAPAWADLASPDLEASRRFYTELFGWVAHVSPAPQAGGYTIFTKDEKVVAGAGPLPTEGQPPAWAAYFLTPDAQATAVRVEGAGGKVLMAPVDVMDRGRAAVFLDPTGAAFSVWQPGARPGADLFDAPGALCWTELATRDPNGAKAFYGAVFGWGTTDNPIGDGVFYTEWKLGGKPIAGMMPMVGDVWPADLPPHWMIYFGVTDCDAAAAQARELGGAVMVPPTDIPGQGRFAVLSDPHGVVFSILDTRVTGAQA